MTLATTLTAGIATAKRALSSGGLLQPVTWERRSGEHDMYGRQAVTTSTLMVLIEDREGITRAEREIERADRTVLTILEPVAVQDTDTFTWGGKTHAVAHLEGVVEDETTGTRFSTEVTVIR